MSLEASIRQRFGSFALDVAFSIQEPGITALFGASGAGKSTTVNALAGLFKPREGRIVIDGRVVLDSACGIFVPPHKRRVGYVFQDARLFPHLNVCDNLKFGWRRAGRRDAGMFADIVALLDLDQLLGRKPANLSGGEKSRVALGRALLANPALLLLDEPLAALDAPRRAEILPWLERLRDEARLPMIYVTHSLEELSRLADNVIVLANGSVVAQGRVFDLLSDFAFAALAGHPAYGAVVPVRVAEHREDDALTLLAFDGGVLAVPLLDRPAGTSLRIRIHAEDVLIAREAPGAISANNVLSACVTQLSISDAVHADVQMVCGATRFVARITRASVARLSLAPGTDVFAIVKSVTIDPRGRDTELA